MTNRIDKAHLLDQYYLCELCNKNCAIESLYACTNGHFYCMRCYKSKRNPTKVSCMDVVEEKHSDHKFKQPAISSQRSRICGELVGRGDLDEYEPEEETAIRSKLMFPNINDMVKQCMVEKALLQSDSLLHRKTGGSSMSLFALSKKPIICPYKNCRRAIAVASMEHHFKHEHKRVAQIKTKLDARNGLDLHVDHVRYNEKLCLVLIDLLDQDNNESTQPQSSSKSFAMRPTFVAIATKIASFGDDYLLQDEDEDTQSVYSNPCTPSDKIFIWMASNIPTRYSHTLAVSTLCSGIRLKYFGPMSTLTEDHEKLCELGQGLLLNQNHVVSMTDNGKRPLKLDILIHDTNID